MSAANTIKPSGILPLAAVFLLGFFCCPAFASAQTQAAAPQNVLDYYLLLPKEEVSLLEYKEQPRQSLIQEKDLANGYLVLGSKDLQGITQVVLFRKKDRSTLIGVAETEQTVASTGSVKFLQYGDGAWRNVTAEVLPKIADEEILAAYNRIKKGDDEARTLQSLPAVYWELPRKGTTVELRCGEDSDSKDKTLMKFAWDGARFTRQAK